VAITFAYGSNMLLAKVSVRAASAKPRGVARLEQFALRWNKRSRDGSGKCSIEEGTQRQNTVWGVLYEMTVSDKERLDRFEGLGHGYEQREVVVLLDGNRTLVPAYYATSVDPGVRPYDWYKEQVVAGAIRHRFPAEYIRELEMVPSIADPDPDRAARERQFLQAGPS